MINWGEVEDRCLRRLAPSSQVIYPVMDLNKVITWPL